MKAKQIIRKIKLREFITIKDDDITAIETIEELLSKLVVERIREYDGYYATKYVFDGINYLLLNKRDTTIIYNTYFQTIFIDKDITYGRTSTDRICEREEILRFVFGRYLKMNLDDYTLFIGD